MTRPDRLLRARSGHITILSLITMKDLLTALNINQWGQVTIILLQKVLKRVRIKKKIYGTWEEARSDIFDYIVMFYMNKFRHSSSDQMQSIKYERQFYQRLGRVWFTRDDSV